MLGKYEIGFSDFIWEGFRRIHLQGNGDHNVHIAVLDGPIALESRHFLGVELTMLPQPWLEAPAVVGTRGRALAHGSAILSQLFSQPPGRLTGLVNGCHGLVAPIYADTVDGGVKPCRQIDLARAINDAVAAGAHIINISGGVRAEPADASHYLQQAVEDAIESGVLIVAAAGNDGEKCSHLPAGLPQVLAVGACDDNYNPLQQSNNGLSYNSHMLLAPGYKLPVLSPSGQIEAATGTSFATSLVSAAAGLLLSIQYRTERRIAPLEIGAALLAAADVCHAEGYADCRRFNIDRAAELLFGAAKGGRIAPPRMSNVTSNQGDGLMPNDQQTNNGLKCFELPNKNSINSRCVSDGSAMSSNEAHNEGFANAMEAYGGGGFGSTPAIESSGGGGFGSTPAIESSGGGGFGSTPAMGSSGCEGFGSTPAMGSSGGGGFGSTPAMGSYGGGGFGPTSNNRVDQMVNPSGSCACKTPYIEAPVFVIGRLQYDFINEARRDSLSLEIKAAHETKLDGPAVAVNEPQMITLLKANPQRAETILWVIYQELTPLYAIQPDGNYGHLVYEKLRGYLEGFHKTDQDRIERIAVGGYLTNRQVTLVSSGISVPVIKPELRSLSSWSNKALLQKVKEREPKIHDAENDVKNFLQRIYDEMRNLGRTSADRAINYTATNLYSAGKVIAEAALSDQRLFLHSITTVSSPISRPGSDCIDVSLNFISEKYAEMNPAVCWLITVDVSDVVPVIIGEPRKSYTKIK